MKRLCIDPGHGLSRAAPRSFDPGAIGGGRREADVNLDYGLALARACDARGVPYWMTRRDNDTASPLFSRAARARSADCDALLSIHCNAFTDPQANGTETLYKQALPFAQAVQRAAMAALNLRDRGCVARPNLSVLQFPGPCALLELGFITNDSDRAVLLHPKTRDRLVAALLDELIKDKWL